jgi:integrase
VTIDGHDIYLGRHGTQSSRNEYDRLIGEYLANDRSLPKDDQLPIKVTQVILKYWRFAEGYYLKDGEPTSEQEGLKPVLRTLKRLYGEKPVEEFGPLALKSIRRQWIQAGHARGTINKNVGRIKRVFKWAASEELIPVEIYQALSTVVGLKVGRSNAHEPEPVSPVDLVIVEKTMQCLCDVVCDMIRVQLLAGMRPAEVCRVRPGDIDRTGDVWEYRPESHKTQHHGKKRVVFFGPDAQAVLMPYLLRAEDAFCFSPREAVAQQRDAQNQARKTPPNHGNRRGHRREGLAGTKAKRQPGQRYDTDSYRRAIHRGCDLAFPPDEQLKGDALKIWQSERRWSPNRLRHTKGTEIRKTFGLEAAQVILGHAAADVTQIYAERDAEKAREVARKIG